MTLNTNLEKKTIYFEHLISSILLRFKEIDNLALRIIGEEISKINQLSFTYKNDDIKTYIEETNFGYTLKKEYLDDNGNILPEVRSIIERYRDNVVIDYLSRMNIEDLVIKKVLDMEILTPADISKRFNKEEQTSIKHLVNTGYLVNIWDDDITNKDYMQIVLSSTGRKRGFVLSFPEYVEEFRKLIASSGYDVALIDEFLDVQDYSKGVYEILNLDNFLNYCQNNRKNPVADGVSSLKYKRIQYKKGEGFSKEGQELFNDMLSVIDDGHCIHICHPNHLFNTKYVIGTSLDFDRINWDDIDIDKMVSVGDYKTFIMPDAKESFKYVHKRLSHQIIKKIDSGQEEQSYLVVVEQYTIDGEYSYLVRGIIKGDKEGYSMAFNPEYEKAISSNVWEKSIRFTGNEVATPYLVKRPSKPGEKR